MSLSFFRYRPWIRPGTKLSLPLRAINEDKCPGIKDGGWLLFMNYSVSNWGPRWVCAVTHSCQAGDCCERLCLRRGCTAFVCLSPPLRTLVCTCTAERACCATRIMCGNMRVVFHCTISATTSVC